MRIYITTARGIVPYLTRELNAFGKNIARTDNTGAEIEGDWEDIYYLNYHLRTAHRIFIPLKKFRAVIAEELYREITDINWEKFLRTDRSLSIHTTVKNDTIKDTRYAGLKCKDAIVDRMRKASGIRPDTGNSFDEAVVYLRWQGSRGEIFLDTSGKSLHRRGYRILKGTAPMQETLAAALLMASGWKADTILVNPMCGSGTIAIEAAQMAAGIPPGYSRKNWAFMHLKNFDPELMKKIISGAEKEIHPPAAPVLAGDIKGSMIRKSRENAKLAGVEKWIDFKKEDFRDTLVPDGEGLVIFNPEYGERMGDEKKLVKLYGEIGDFLKKNCAGKTAAIFTTSTRLQKSVGLRTAKKIQFYAGALEGRLLIYRIYKGSKK